RSGRITAATYRTAASVITCVGCRSRTRCCASCLLFFFKQKTAYEIGLGIPAEPLFRSRIFLMSSLMLLLVWLIFFMVLIKLLPILGTISGKTVKLMVLALICLGNNRQD